MRRALRMMPSADLVAEDFAALVDLHEAGEDEAVFVGTQGAHAGRERGREHGDGAVGKVDAGAAEAGFEVERGAGADVVADVGDVDLELAVAVGERVTRTASSKSRAVSPSMVTMGRPRKSCRG